MEMIFAIVAFFAGIGLALFESTFWNAVALGGMRPDLAVIAVAVGTSRLEFRRSMTLAFALGFARDFFSGGAAGMNAFSLILMAYVLIEAQNYLMTRNWGSQILVVFLGSVCFGGSFALLKLILGYEIGSSVQIATMIALTSVYTSLLAPFAFMLTDKPHFPSYRRLKTKYDVEHETLPPTEV